MEKAQTAFEETEKKLQLGPFVILNQVIRESLTAGLSMAGMETTTEDEETVLDAVKAAMPFPDV